MYFVIYCCLIVSTRKLAHLRVSHNQIKSALNVALRHGRRPKMLQQGVGNVILAPEKENYKHMILRRQSPCPQEEWDCVVAAKLATRQCRHELVFQLTGFF